MSRTLHVSFVCSGNICRSPMAALVFREQLRGRGLADRVTVTSAGTGGWHVGENADPRALETLARAGYPTDHVAAAVGSEHLAADLLIALDIGHQRELRHLLQRAGRDPGSIRLLRSFDPAAPGDLDVPDPYYGGGSGFDRVLNMIEASMPGLLGWVQENLETPQPLVVAPESDSRPDPLAESAGQTALR
ncbi:MAG: low molecular weight protein-tyrosine-phosphatase [Actinomycetota bacterium]